METRNSTNKDKEKIVDKDMLLAELLRKTDLTNELLKDLIEVCRQSRSDNPMHSNLDINSLMDEDETSLKTFVTHNKDENSYQSPTQLIQREVNELALQKEATRIKQSVKLFWSQILNSRKQTYWKQISNAKRAEYYEKWLNQENPVIPRKFRIKPIKGEPSDQTDVRIEIAKKRVMGEIQLLRMRAENNQAKIITFDSEIERELNSKASGRILELLQEMWTSDCREEEQTSFQRLRYTETWLLDYERNYGQEMVKENKPKKMQQKQQQTFKKSYASAVRNKENTSTMQEGSSFPTHFTKPPSSKRINANSEKSNQHGNSTRICDRDPFKNRQVPRQAIGSKRFQSRIKTNIIYQNNRRSRNQPNFYNNKRTTSIGRGVRNYFLGGGKPNQGVKHKTKYAQLPITRNLRI